MDLSYISLIMIAGNQNNIGMAVLPRHENKTLTVPDLNITPG
jgi:hypothetical protein